MAAPPGSRASLSATDAPTVDLATDTDGTWELALVVQNTAGRWDPTPDHVRVVAAPEPPVADAGPDRRHVPLDAVTLDGTDSTDPGGHEPLTWAWTLVSKPARSSAQLDDDQSARPSFIADLAGDYVFELSVTNALGVADPTPDTVEITVRPADGFYVELTWTGQGDLDLHLSNAAASGIFDCPNDCSFDEPNPSWGPGGRRDDPTLDADTIPGQRGLGPEIITIDDPATDTFTVDVHYFGRNGSASCTNCPDADATVNVYLGGVLAATFSNTLHEDDEHWTVADIEWPSGLVDPRGNRLRTTSLVQCF